MSWFVIYKMFCNLVCLRNASRRAKTCCLLFSFSFWMSRILETIFLSSRISVDPGETLFLMTDSESQESLFYRLPVNNFERTDGKGNSCGNTYQTYIWTESKSEIQQKVVNPTSKNVFKQAITPPFILTISRF